MSIIVEICDRINDARVAGFEPTKLELSQEWLLELLRLDKPHSFGYGGHAPCQHVWGVPFTCNQNLKRCFLHVVPRQKPQPLYFWLGVAA